MSLFRVVKPTGCSQKFRSYRAPGRFRQHFLSDMGRELIWAFLESGDPARVAGAAAEPTTSEKPGAHPRSRTGPRKRQRKAAEDHPKCTRFLGDANILVGARCPRPAARPPPRSALAAAADHRALVCAPAATHADASASAVGPRRGTIAQDALAH
ncbi:hypothetical protein IscW_ISCW015907 [Ixodes scapularis]|uniref:Uncharacterized protein n=1 Tax=Ixodes scapularis TaxID=6945 RepID=B7P1D0_IXOSC|nr:hypothetical protein IscW_ISCW015907 [Ixodes scapularis]|eukprot:XP_002433338.1 hypothetical protein IscW_ISCW015907 [Ixodes scapularis]